MAFRLELKFTFSKLSRLLSDVIFFASYCILLLLFAFTAKAEKQSLKVVTEILQPFQYLDSKGRAVGFGVDVLEAILEKIDLKPEYEFLPWQRAFKKASTTENMVILAMARTKEREHLFHWIGHLQRETFSFYALKTNAIGKQESLESIKKHSLIVTKDSVLDNYVTKLDFPNVERSNDVQQTYLMLYRKRVDLIFKSHTSIHTQTNNFGYDYDALMEVYKVPDFHTDLYVAIGINSDPQLVSKLVNGFSSIKTDGTYKKIRNKWFTEE